MTQIQELERRIVAALDRIGQGVEAFDGIKSAQPEPVPAPDPEEIAQLEAALENERTNNAQLEERVQAIRETQQTQVHSLRAELESKRAASEQLDRDLQRLRKSNDLLRQSNDALRTALEEGLGDADLINAGLVAELEGLRATRAADVAENRAVLAALEPLLVDAADTASNNGSPAQKEGGA